MIFFIKAAHVGTTQREQQLLCVQESLFCSRISLSERGMSIIALCKWNSHYTINTILERVVVKVLSIHFLQRKRTCAHHHPGHHPIFFLVNLQQFLRLVFHLTASKRSKLTLRLMVKWGVGVSMWWEPRCLFTVGWIQQLEKKSD